MKSFTRIRWMLHGDWKQVVEIAAASYADPLTMSSVRGLLRQRETIGLVWDTGDQSSAIAGYVIFNLMKKHVDLIDLAVAAGYRFQGIGTELLAKLKGRLSSGRRSKLIACVDEANTAAHLFLKANGFSGTSGELDGCYEFVYAVAGK